MNLLFVRYYAAPPTLRLHKGLGSYAKNATSLTPERVWMCVELFVSFHDDKSIYLGAFTTEWSWHLAKNSKIHIAKHIEACICGKT